MVFRKTAEKRKGGMRRSFRIEIQGCITFIYRRHPEGAEQVQQPERILRIVFQALQRFPVEQDPGSAAHDPSIKRKTVQPMVHIAQGPARIHEEIMAVHPSLLQGRPDRRGHIPFIVKQRSVNIKKQQHSYTPGKQPVSRR